MARELLEDKTRNMVSSAGFCYSDVSSSNPTIQTPLVNQIHGFESNPEIFNLTANIGMIGFSKNLQEQQGDSNSVMWKSFFNKPGNSNPSGGPSTSKTINESTADFYQHEFKKPDFPTGISETSNENLIVGPDSTAWQENRMLVDDSSLRCVFPCEGNERPSQGLSLSLSSSNPSSIGLQSFELRHTANHHNHDNQQEEMRFFNSSSRDGLIFGKSSLSIQREQQMIQDGFLSKAANLHQQGQFQLRNSMYLGPAQELLSEFCSLGTKQPESQKQKPHKPRQWDDENSSARSQALCSLDFMELQKRKTKLLSMLEEVYMFP
uniref:POX domain-containing protein n=1 Tax=Rhizophora mucronata TaxID=61149 RepID=A0A2P2MGY5_RHIMU